MPDKAGELGRDADPYSRWTLVVQQALPGVSETLARQLANDARAHHCLPAVEFALDRGAQIPEEIHLELATRATQLADDSADLAALDHVRDAIQGFGESAIRAQQLTDETSGEATPTSEQLDLALKEVRAALDTQWDQWKHLETRLQFLLGWIATGTGLSVALGVGKFAPNDGTRVLLFGAGAFAVFSLATLVFAYLPQAFLRPPEPVGFAERYVLADPRDTKLMLIDTITEAYTSNQVALDRRTTFLRYAVEAATAGVFLALLALASTTLGTGG